MDIISEYQDLKISIWVSQKISMDIKSNPSILFWNNPDFKS